jgi:hypothetical protein
MDFNENPRLLNPIQAPGFVQFQFCKKPICVLKFSQLQGPKDTKNLRF